MSRSYKKTPYAGDNKTKWAKRQVNKQVRHYLNRQMIQDESFAPAAYKKVSESWDICDYCSIFTLEKWLKDKWNLSRWNRRNIFEEKRIQEWYKWYKRK